MKSKNVGYKLYCSLLVLLGCWNLIFPDFDIGFSMIVVGFTLLWWERSGIIIFQSDRNKRINMAKES